MQQIMTALHIVLAKAPKENVNGNALIWMNGMEYDMPFNNRIGTEQPLLNLNNYFIYGVALKRNAISHLLCSTHFY